MKSVDADADDADANGFHKDLREMLQVLPDSLRKRQITVGNYSSLIDINDEFITRIPQYPVDRVSFSNFSNFPCRTCTVLCGKVISKCLQQVIFLISNAFLTLKGHRSLLSLSIIKSRIFQFEQQSFFIIIFKLKQNLLKEV